MIDYSTLSIGDTVIVARKLAGFEQSHGVHTVTEKTESFVIVTRCDDGCTRKFSTKTGIELNTVNKGSYIADMKDFARLDLMNKENECWSAIRKEAYSKNYDGVFAELAKLSELILSKNK